MGSLTNAADNMNLQEITRTIQITMRRSAKDAVQLGYMLRRVLDNRLYLEAYTDFDAWLDAELKMEYTMATRFININKKYSAFGGSMEIAAQYADYTQGALIEMLSMPQEQMEQVTPDMTVREIREIKRASRPVKEAVEVPVQEECFADVGKMFDGSEEQVPVQEEHFGEVNKMVTVSEDQQIPGQMKLEDTAKEAPRLYLNNDELEPKDADLLRFLVVCAVKENRISYEDFTEDGYTPDLLEHVNVDEAVYNGVEYSLFAEEDWEHTVVDKPGFAEVSLSEDMTEPFIYIQNEYLVKLIMLELREQRNMCCFNTGACTFTEGSRLHRIEVGHCPSNCCMSCEERNTCGHACMNVAHSKTKDSEKVATSQPDYEQVNTGLEDDFEDLENDAEEMEIITDIQEPEETEILTVPVDLDIEEDVIDGEFRELEPEEMQVVAAGLEENRPHDEGWFVEQYLRILPGEAQKLIDICRKDISNSDKAQEVQKHIAPYGCHCRSCSEYDFDWHGFAGGIDMRIDQEKMHMKYGRFVVELMRILEREDAKLLPVNTENEQEDGLLSAYGLEKTVYPEGSTLSTAGCGHKHDCFSCAQECEIRQEERYCRSAPLGNPFSCETMTLMETLRDEIGEACQFVDHSKAYHTAGSLEAVPCCRECSNPCEYVCKRAAVLEERDRKVSEEGERQEVSAKEVLDNMHIRLNNMLTTPERFSPRQIEQQKIIVAALASMVSELGLQEMKEELAKLETEVTQPELPELKNQESRKAWLEDYKAWGLWYRDENIDVEYYKYDFSDGSRLIATVYPAREGIWVDKQEDQIRYHFLEKGKKKCGSKRTYDEKYRETPNSITELVEWLKNFQKREN